MCDVWFTKLSLLRYSKHIERSDAKNPQLSVRLYNPSLSQPNKNALKDWHHSYMHTPNYAYTCHIYQYIYMSIQRLIRTSADFKCIVF